MTKVKLAEKVKKSCLKDNEGFYYLIPIIINRKLIDDETFNKLVERFPKIDNQMWRLLYYTECRNPLGYRIVSKENKTTRG